MDPLKYWPSSDKTPRPAQVEAIRRCYEAIESGKKYIVLESPTGSGKSMTAATLSAIYDTLITQADADAPPVKKLSTWFLTLTKSLQDQYSHDSDLLKLGLVELKGRSAYSCGRLEQTGGTCQDGAMKFRGNHRCSPNECSYQLAKAAALAAPRTVANYHSFNAVGRRAATRRFMVFDEAHALERRILSETATLKLAFDDIPEEVFGELYDADGNGIMPHEFSEMWPTMTNTVEEVAPILKILSGAAKRIVENAMDPEAVESHEGKTVEWCTTFLDTVNGQREVIRRKDKVLVERGEEHRSFVMTPVYGRALAKRFFDCGDIILLMSGTIIDHATFCKDLDIPLEQSAFIQLPCTFPKENRPIYVGNLNMRKTGGHYALSKGAMVDEIGRAHV